jgi:hypothetical protein
MWHFRWGGILSGNPSSLHLDEAAVIDRLAFPRWRGDVAWSLVTVIRDKSTHVQFFFLVFILFVGLHRNWTSDD